MGAPNISHSFTWADNAILVASIVLSLGIGLYQAFAGGRQRTTDEYLLANRQVRVLPAALSLAVSYISGISLLGFPAEAYYYGISILFMVVGMMLEPIIGAIFYVPLFYPLRLTSINEYLKQRFKSRTVVLLAWSFAVLNQVIFTGLVLYGPAVTLQAMAGFPSWASMLVMGLVGTVYTSCGGLKAVIWSDVFQAVVILGGLLTIVIKGTSLAGGLYKVIQLYHDGGKTAVETVLLAVLPQFILLPLCCLCGIVAYAYFAKESCDPFAAGYISSPNQILPYFVMVVLRYPGCPGAFCAAIVCGTLSNFSSSITAITALTWSDFLAVKLRHMSDARKTNIVKMFAIGFGLLSLGVSYIVALFGGTIMKMTAVLLGLSTAPLMVMFLFSPMFPRLNWKSVTAGVLASFLFSTFFGVGGLLVDTRQYIIPEDNNRCWNKTNDSVNATDAVVNVTDYEGTHRYGDETAMAGIDGERPTTERSLRTVDNHTHDRPKAPWEKLFHLSPYWITPFSFVVGSAVAMVASIIPGCYRVGKPTPRLYLRCIWAAMRKINGGEENDSTDVEECNVGSELNPPSL